MVDLWLVGMLLPLSHGATGIDFRPFESCILPGDLYFLCKDNRNKKNCYAAQRIMEYKNKNLFCVPL